MKKKSRHITRSFLLITTLLIINHVKADVRLPAIFSDDMVLQQKSEAIFWGWASPGEKITIKAGWSSAIINIIADKSGKWQTKIKTTAAGGPYNITISGKNTIVVKNVLLGEVWLCSGQSNMGFTLKSDAYAKEEIPKANYPDIRYFSVARQYGDSLFEDCPGSKWELTTPQTAPSYSAVAYYFAKNIYEKLKVPVGIVYNAWGGTPAEAWIPWKVMNGNTSLSVYFDRWQSILDHVGADSTAYFNELKKWQADSTGKKKPAEPQSYYYFKRPWREPAVLFNGMVNPVIPYAIKGFLWYQGESNVMYADEYFHLFGSMINSWRKKWKDAGYKTNLPFYFVQLAANGYSDMDAAARLREAQEQIIYKIPNTGMAVSLDLGEMDDIHYKRKREVGDRLALIALAKNYNVKGISYQGPRFIKMLKGEGRLMLQFESAMSLATKDNQPLNGFEAGYYAARADTIIYKRANVKLENGKVIIYYDTPEPPDAVRYGWLFPAEANLFDKNGLPAFPFRWNRRRRFQ